MKPRPHKVLKFIFNVANNKFNFFFWFFVRFVSAIFPLITIYQFSNVIKLIETGQSPTLIFQAIILIFVVRIIDNILRLKSVTRLENEIAELSFDIHNFFLSSLKIAVKEDRLAAVQAVRNFADASSVTLNLVKQPGIDSLVSFIFIPVILFFLDFHTFTLTTAYIIIYFFIDYYCTQHYARLKDTLNYKTESYFARLQENQDFELEQKALGRHFNRLTRWGFTEWSLLQNLSVFFYSAIFIYLVVLTTNGQRQLSDVVLIMGYVTQTQVFLNSFSSINDSLTDMLVGLQRLAANGSVSVLSLDDLI